VVDERAIVVCHGRSPGNHRLLFRHQPVGCASRLSEHLFLGLAKCHNQAEASKPTAEKSEPAALDPSALDMLGALGGSDADADASVEEAAESATSAKINSSPTASETDLSNSFAMLSDLSSMTDTDEGETLPGTEET